MLRPFLAAVALAAAFGAAEAGSATTRGDVVVRYNDLNLSKERDARQMLQRLSAAAHRACGGSPFLRDHSPGTGPFVLADYLSCRDAALAQAVASLRAPVVSRLFAESRQNEPHRNSHRIAER